MHRLLASGIVLAAFGLAQAPDPAAACNCKYDANCPSGYFCKINAIACAGQTNRGTCTRIVSDAPLPNPTMTNPRRPSSEGGSPGGMTAQ